MYSIDSPVVVNRQIIWQKEIDLGLNLSTVLYQNRMKINNSHCMTTV